MAKNYYQLTFSTSRGDYWHLSTPSSKSGPAINIWNFTQCVPYVGPSDLEIEIIGFGFPAEITFSSFGALYASPKIALAIKEIAGDDIQLIPVKIKETGEKIFILNVLREVECVDESRSRFDKFTPEDGRRPDRIGYYCVISDLFVDPDLIDNYPIFRVKKWNQGLIISETVKNMLEVMQVIGVEYHNVTA